MLDLDHFKQINDTYGHRRGDEVLIAMARYLKSHACSAAATDRMDGDEFLVLVHEDEAAAD